jgi:hypothetical protein
LHADLKSLVLKLLEEVAELRRTVAVQRDEIARLKGGPGQPDIKPSKPSGMDKATEPKPPPAAGGEPRPKGSKTSKLSINETRTVKVASPPDGSRFKGYASFIVQDLVIRPLRNVGLKVDGTSKPTVLSRSEPRADQKKKSRS